MADTGSRKFRHRTLPCRCASPGRPVEGRNRLDGADRWSEKGLGVHEKFYVRSREDDRRPVDRRDGRRRRNIQTSGTSSRLIIRLLTIPRHPNRWRFPVREEQPLPTDIFKEGQSTGFSKRPRPGEAGDSGGGHECFVGIKKDQLLQSGHPFSGP